MILWYRRGGDNNITHVIAFGVHINNNNASNVCRTVSRPRWASCRARFTAAINIPRERPEGVRVSRRRSRCRRSARRTWVCSAEAPSNRFALLGVSCNNNVHYLLYNIDTYYRIIIYVLLYGCRKCALRTNMFVFRSRRCIPQ